MALQSEGEIASLTGCVVERQSEERERGREKGIIKKRSLKKNEYESTLRRFEAEIERDGKVSAVDVMWLVTAAKQHVTADKTRGGCARYST